MSKINTEFNARKINHLLLDLEADAKTFGLGNVESDIEQLTIKMKEWGIPSDKCEVVSAVVKPKDGRIYVVTRNAQDEFRINRFFMLGNNWEISVDKDDRSLSEIIEYLLEEI